MYNGCRHIKTSGLPCKSRALAGGSFCYFHAHLHNHPAGPEPTVLKMPLVEDLAAIPLAVARISEALIADRIDVKKSAQLLWGLKLVFQAITFRPDYEDEEEDGPEDTVGSVTPSPEGDLGPEETYCFPSAEECNACKSKTCSDSPMYRVHSASGKPDEHEQEDDQKQDDDDRDSEDDGDNDQHEDDKEGGSCAGGENKDEEDDDDDDDGEDDDDSGDESTKELVATAKYLESITDALDKGDMRQVERLLKE